MTDDLTALRAEAERLLKDITSGEWRVGSGNEDVNSLRPSGAVDSVGTCFWNPHDAEFIAAAPSLIRRLLAALPTAPRMRKLTVSRRDALAARIAALDQALIAALNRVDESRTHEKRFLDVDEAAGSTYELVERPWYTAAKALTIGQPLPLSPPETEQ